MARTGGFSGTINPFGSGSLGGLSQYDIGADLADLEVYKVEVAWGNGLATDEDYLAALTKAVNATDPNTQRRESAVNKFDDATYRIGRSKAEAVGLDELIAFDQAAIAKMNPSNVRYRDVQDSLQSEQASRRSRDYGKLVTAYNDGKGTTESLLTWVDSQLGSLTSDDPDFLNWTQVQGDLGDRIVSEKDQKVYQDYQQGRTKAPAFLAYITSRRDAYGVGTPQYIDWANKVEDAQKQITDNAQSEKDSAFFNRYQEGKVSDTTYLKYLHDRIAGMKPDDPALGDWKHRLVAATFSLAEDKLRFDVGRGKQPASRLVSFYKAYQRTLNPGSAEWRTVQRNLDTLHGGTGGSSGGGSGGTRRTGGSSGGAGGTSAGSAIGGKVITGGKYTLDNVLGVFSINPNASKAAISKAAAYLANNKSSLYNALQNGDAVWLFTDPRKPNAVVAELDPQGNPTGRMVRGAAYLPAKNETYTNILLAEAGNLNGASEVMLANHEYKKAADLNRRAAEAFDNARKNDAGYRTQNTAEYVKNLQGVIDQATKANDYALAARTAVTLGIELDGQLRNPYLTDTERDKLEKLGDKIAASPLLPDPATGLSRAINMDLSTSDEIVLSDGWHHSIKTNSEGQPDWGPEFSLDPEWDAKHVTVRTAFGNDVVTGDVKRDKAPFAPTVVLRTTTSEVQIPAGPGGDFITYVDERGHVVRAYSNDGGVTWISSAAGVPAPQLEVNEPVQLSDDGLSYVLVSDPAKVVLTQGESGGWQEGPDAAGKVGWYGQAAWEVAKVQREVHGSRGIAMDTQLKDYIDRMDVGGPGQHMMIGTIGERQAGDIGYAGARQDGVLNLIDPSFYRTDYMSRPGFSRKDKEQMTPAERALVTVNDDLANRIKGGQVLPGMTPTQTYDTNYGRTEADVARMMMQAPQGDRSGGYGLGNYKVPVLKPKPPSGATATRTPRPTIVPPLNEAPGVLLGLAKSKAVLPPVFKGKAADDLLPPLKPKPTLKPTPTGKKKAGRTALPKPMPRPTVKTIARATRSGVS